MNKYEVKYNGTKFYYYGEDASDAMDKFANRKVFSHQLIFDYRLMQYDADTRGKEWAQFRTIEPEHIVLVSIVN